MKKTFYILKNFSASEGIYFIDGDYKSLYPGDEITLEKMPVNKTANISLITYKKEIPSSVPLNVKTVVTQPKNEVAKQKSNTLVSDNIQKQNDAKIKKEFDKE